LVEGKKKKTPSGHGVKGERNRKGVFLRGAEGEPISSVNHIGELSDSSQELTKKGINEPCC